MTSPAPPPAPAPFPTPPHPPHPHGHASHGHPNHRHASHHKHSSSHRGTSHPHQPHPPIPFHPSALPYPFPFPPLLPLPLSVSPSYHHLFSLLLSPSPLLTLISPSSPSHHARALVFLHLSSLLSSLSPCPLFLFGSTPLRTYLPSGDLDVGLVLPRVEDADRVLLRVKELLEHPPLSTGPQWPVHSVSFVSGAEVKLIKCQVGSILVDISTNTASALATVCLLEEVDREIDRSLALHYPPPPPPAPSAGGGSVAWPPASSSPSHLLKQSILVIKAWALYESHVLASHHSLLSTYAIETMVMYILNHYHHHLHHTAADPLVVLSLFCHVFSVFAWEEWALTVTGPILLHDLTAPHFAQRHLFSLSTSAASLSPMVAAQFPHSPAPLLSPSFFHHLYARYYSPPLPSASAPASSTLPSRPFLLKPINIVDPLDLSNNLGRSVSFSNMWRVRLCLKKGCGDMERIMMEGRDLVDWMGRELDDAGVGRASGRGKAGRPRGKGWSDDAMDVLSDGVAFHQTIAVLLPSAVSSSSPLSCAALPFSSPLLHRLCAHHVLVRSLFAHTFEQHESQPRPDLHLIDQLRLSGHLIDDGQRLLSTLSISPRSSIPSALSPSATSSLIHRLLLPASSPALSRDDSSLSLPPRAPASSRSLFISTISHPPPQATAVVSGTFSPLLEPSSCPPPSSAVSPRLSSSCPPSPVPSVSPSPSPSLPSTPSPSPPLGDPLAASLSQLMAVFVPLQRYHRALLQSYYPQMSLPSFASHHQPQHRNGHRGGFPLHHPRAPKRKNRAKQHGGGGGGGGGAGGGAEEKETPPVLPVPGSPSSASLPQSSSFVITEVGPTHVGKRKGGRGQHAQTHAHGGAAGAQAFMHPQPAPTPLYPQHAIHRRQYVNAGVMQQVRGFLDREEATVMDKAVSGAAPMRAGQAWTILGGISRPLNGVEPPAPPARRKSDSPQKAAKGKARARPTWHDDTNGPQPGHHSGDADSAGESRVGRRSGGTASEGEQFDQGPLLSAATVALVSAPASFQSAPPMPASSPHAPARLWSTAVGSGRTSPVALSASEPSPSPLSALALDAPSSSSAKGSAHAPTEPQGLTVVMAVDGAPVVTAPAAGASVEASVSVPGPVYPGPPKGERRKVRKDRVG